MQTHPGKLNEEKPEQNNNPEEAITTPQEVPESNDEKIDEDFPGYPHYPAKEDLLDPRNSKRVDLDIENLSRSHKIDPLDVQSLAGKNVDIADEIILETDDEETTEADVTAEEIALLDGDTLHDTHSIELDVPGDDMDDENELIGEEDEENNYYSIGGDNHEDLEEDKS